MGGDGAIAGGPKRLDRGLIRRKGGEGRRPRVQILGGATQTSMATFQDPRAYCKALTDKWREFRTSQVDTVEAVAISKCEAGDYAAGIPVLEDALITAKMPLPAAGFRWPGRSYAPS